MSALVAERGLKLDLEIDGGIDEGNMGEVAKLGGNVFVAGAGRVQEAGPGEGDRGA